MSRTLTASDRNRLVRLAATLPKGSSERRAILASIKVAYSLNAGQVPLDKAREYAAEVFGRPVDEVLPNFDKNYMMLQKKVKQSPAIPRIQMPVIEPSDIDEFNDALNAGRVDVFAPYTKGKLVGPHEIDPSMDGPWVELGIKDGDSSDDVVRAKMTNVPVGKLKPTQNQIWLEKTFGNIAKWGAPKSGSPVLSTTIIVSSDGYILDGHHRFSQAIMADPSLKMRALVVPMPINQLLEIGRYYGEAIGNKAKQASGDRGSLVRLASTLPKGSNERRQILSMLKNSDLSVSMMERAVDKAKTLSGVDPMIAKYIVDTGLKDGDARDDVVPMGKATEAAGKLKPSQTTMQLPKTLGMAIAMLLGKMPLGGDLGAIISADNHILDGHHRWSAAIAAGGPGVSVGGYKAKLKGEDLLKVLNIVTKGMFGRNKGNPGSGNIKAYTPANAEKVLRKMIEEGTQFLSAEEVQEALSRLGGSVEEGIAKMSENIGAVSKAVPSWAPDRADMPVINEKDLPATSQALNSGVINWNNPYHPQEKKALTRLASTLPKGSSERRTLLAMLKSAGLAKKAWNDVIRDIKRHPAFVEIHEQLGKRGDEVAAFLVEYSEDNPNYEGGFRVEVYDENGEILIDEEAPRGARTNLRPFLAEGQEEWDSMMKAASRKRASANKKKAYGPGKKITVEDLEEIGGNGLRGDEDLEGLARMLNSAYGMRGAEKAMREADKVLDTYGVEAVFEEGEYMTPAMMYLNTGDTYNATIVYDVDEDELYASTWGDWVEYAERQGRRMR